MRGNTKPSTSTGMAILESLADQSPGAGASAALANVDMVSPAKASESSDTMGLT